MKYLVKSTIEMKNVLDRVKLTRMNTVSITDKAMSALAIDAIGIGDLKAITFFNIMNDETDEESLQVVFSSVDGQNYSTCSKVAYSLADELYSVISSGDCNISDIGLTFGYAYTRGGNKYLSVNII